jgi:acetolactate synthase-1/2/3 large subunit
LQQNINTYIGNDVLQYKKMFDHESHLSKKQCEAFYHLLMKAERPLLYLGGGLNSDRGSAAIKKFNALFTIPSVNTLMAKGVIDEDAPLSLGLLGMFGTPYANKIIQKNDLFFALGVRWDDRVAEKVGFAIDAKIAYIDINASKVQQIRKERRPEFSFVGDAAIALEDLTEYAEKENIKITIEGWQKYAVNLKKSWPLNFNQDSDKIQQAAVLARLNQLIDSNVIVTTGVGNHQLLAAQYLQMKKPKSFLTSGSFGTMGFGMPVAIGASYANPDAKIIVIDGDGSFRMNMGEMHTIGALRLPVKVLLLNNRSDGMVRNLEDTAYGGRHSATERTADICFAELAKNCGYGFSKRVTLKSELQAALEEFMISQGPCLLEIMTDIDEIVYPIVRPGGSYAEMDLGPYIKETI